MSILPLECRLLTKIEFVLLIIERFRIMIDYILNYISLVNNFGKYNVKVCLHHHIHSFQYHIYLLQLIINILFIILNNYINCFISFREHGSWILCNICSNLVVSQVRSSQGLVYKTLLLLIYRPQSPK